MARPDAEVVEELYRLFIDNTSAESHSNEDILLLAFQTVRTHLNDLDAFA